MSAIQSRKVCKTTVPYAFGTWEYLNKIVYKYLLTTQISVKDSYTKANRNQLGDRLRHKSLWHLCSLYAY